MLPNNYTIVTHLVIDTMLLSATVNHRVAIETVHPNALAAKPWVRENYDWALSQVPVLPNAMWSPAQMQESNSQMYQVNIL